MNKEQIPPSNDPIKKIEEMAFNHAKDRATKDSEYMYILSEIHSLEQRLRIIQKPIPKDIGYSVDQDKYLQKDISDTKIKIEELRQKASLLKDGGLIFDEQDSEYSIAREALEWLREVVKRWQVGGDTAFRQLDEELSDGFRDSIIENEDTLNHMEILAIDKLKEAINQGVPHELKKYILETIADYLKVGNDTKLMTEAKIIADKLAE